jgi:hypothetical protein
MKNPDSLPYRRQLNAGFTMTKTLLSQLHFITVPQSDAPIIPLDHNSGDW